MKDKSLPNSEECESLGIETTKLILGAVLGILGLFLKMPSNINTILIILSYLILIYSPLTNGLKDLLNKKLSEDTLVSISTLGALILGEMNESLAVLFLYELGELLEKIALNNSRKSIAHLMNIKEENATIKDKDALHKVPCEKVKVGDIIVVRTGEKIPLDGIVVKGSSYIDTSTLTGESKLVMVKEKSLVSSGTINKQGVIEVQTTSEYKNSRVNKILELVETATQKKSSRETFISKYSTLYTISVLIIALIVTSFFALTGTPLKTSIYKGLTLLLIACPCAIVISVPLAYFTALGKASRQGILIKGSSYLDGLKDITDIAFDKTGTITTGKFYISKITIYDKKYTEEEVMKILVKGEALSNHPIATSILEKYSSKVSSAGITNFKEIVGEGITFKYQNKQIKIGSSKLCSVKDSNNQDIYLKINNKLVSSFTIEDEIKNNAKEVIQTLENMHIKVHLYTGDTKEKATALAKKLNISSTCYEMMPEQKYHELEKLINTKKEGAVISFIGDGVNDAPALALSDIGISMGALGTDVAIEASDIVIMNDNLNSIVTAIAISNKTNSIIKQNLFFALIIKILVLILTLFGITIMWQAVFADVGVTLICIFNTFRILKS